MMSLLSLRIASVPAGAEPLLNYVRLSKISVTVKETLSGSAARSISAVSRVVLRNGLALPAA